jgi:glycosyltransferase involved in cell wall biosynthesis
MSIALLAIMLNEADYVGRWVEAVRRVGGAFDRALVIDGGSTDGTAELLRELEIEVISRPFGNHFADQRNHGLSLINTDWVFELDADEMASPPLLGGLRHLIANAESAQMDVIGVPRLNFIDGQLVASPGSKGLDYQYRLHRTSCRWRGAVHEEVVGYRARYELNVIDGHFIVHDKTDKRHQARNEYYRTIKP